MPTPIKWSLGILLPVVLILCVLSFSNPQSSSHIYNWQANIFPAYGMDFPVLEKYTGHWKEWDSKGLLLSETEYLDGKANGKVRMWYQNGDPKSESSFKNDVPHGFFKTWDTNRQIIGLMQFQNGKLNGFQINWHSNGKLKVAIFCEKFITIGISKNWDSSGGLEEIFIWDGKGNDAKINATTIYDPSKNMDLRHKYNKEIADFENQLALWEKEHKEK